MKSIKPLVSILRIAMMASVLGWAATFTVHASGRGGASGLLPTRPTPPVPPVESQIVMDCPDCKNGHVPRKVEPRGLGARMLIGQTGIQAVHRCPKCKSAWKNSGAGRATIVKPVHACGTCVGAR